MSNRAKSFAALMSLLCIMLLISACSGAANTNNAAPGNSAAPSNDAGGQQTEGQDEEVAQTDKFPRTVKAANGEITIEKEPKKVAVVHWGYGDSLLLFDLPSVALALPFTEKQSVLATESYKPYVDKHDELVVVGENTQVNMEALLAYAPDLIIAGNSVNQAVGGELEKIAPTVVIDEAETDVWANWPALVAKFGEILGQEDAAQSYIAEYENKLKTAKEKLAGLEGTVAFLQVRADAVWLQGVDYLKPYYEGMGLTPPAGDVMAEGAQLTLEGLSELDADHLFLGYFNYSDQSVGALTDEWDDSAVWKSLKAVQSGQVYAIDGQLALSYGPIGNSYGVQAVLEALE
ncbi:ABC transporter substrate-binding protein [Paenibacillus arenilitoris]|uniref:ABC transporter substrate-binding protein n=1 Tax=Paenibacillus arenilitoris TaxID=2772299 RepID=A0A927CPB5_9BACL|nr:ABC transporter substrate-binding protein [Paenibacillus arenilitoris]MBD2870592.1 ABC transporter substrate-binding protein [Paenibacillus arenilitoris]